jgi:glycosyltransferase involved in cell wall biosynthesis
MGSNDRRPEARSGGLLVESSRPILHIVTRLEAGGVPLSVLPLLDRLNRQGIPVELATGITPPPAVDMLPDARALGIPVHVIPSFRRNPDPIQDLRCLFSLIRLIRARRPILVHTHTSKAGFIGRLATRLADRSIRQVYSPHGTILEGYFKGVRRWVFTILDRVAARWSDAIIGLTREESESYLAAGIGTRDIHLDIPIGIDHTRFARTDGVSRSAKRRSLDVDDEEVLLISVGRLVPVKDYATLIRGLGHLGTEPNWQCWIIGSGPEEMALRQLIDKEGLQEKVRLWGYREDVDDLLGLADIFILSSVNEGFGRVLLEAMAAELAIVATDVGGVSSVLDDGRAGILIPASSPAEMAEALIPLIRSPRDLDMWAEKGHARILSTYSAEEAFKAHCRLYDRLLKK